jgi:hypothetical protein
MALWIKPAEMREQLETARRSLRWDVEHRFYWTAVEGIKQVIADTTLQGSGYAAFRERLSSNERSIADAYVQACSFQGACIASHVARTWEHFPNSDYQNSDDICAQIQTLKQQLAQREQNFFTWLQDAAMDIADTVDIFNWFESQSKSLRNAIAKLEERLQRLHDYNQATSAIYDKSFEILRQLNDRILVSGYMRYDSSRGVFVYTSGDAERIQAALNESLSGAQAEISRLYAESEDEYDYWMQERAFELLNQSRYSEAVWNTLTDEERKTRLAEFLAELQGILGTSANPSISYEPEEPIIPSFRSYGVYYHNGGTADEIIYPPKTIYVNPANFAEGDSYDLYNTVMHELRHCYQFETAEGVTAHVVGEETKSQWITNLDPDNYKRPEEDGWDAYYTQPVEWDAKGFAKEYELMRGKHAEYAGSWEETYE